MTEITVVFETYSDQVNHTLVTGEYAVIQHLALAVRDGDNTFCIRTENGLNCRCDEFQLRA